ncbi:ABC transporter substrate-binding protein [Cutibacterium granulosum]|uniref:ABC transporter substrate-binding protein n=1 Tax=Cutibacterium granulosum TaxID=33011 RepID=UPI0023F9A7FE|nr:extracellular solute-binding protein [Cutibacterium granulosum]
MGRTGHRGAGKAGNDMAQPGRRTVLSLLAASAAVTACTPRARDRSASGEDHRVRVWHELPPNEQARSMTQMAFDFGRRRPASAITIHESMVGPGYLAQLRKAIDTADAPSLAQLPDILVPQFAQEGILGDVTGFAEQYRDIFDRGPMSHITYLDRIQGLPLDSSPLVLFYDVEAWGSAGVAVPTTWDDLLKVGTTLAGRGRYITDFPVNDIAWFAAICDAAGAPWFRVTDDGDWQINIDSAQVAALALTWQKLVRDAGLPLSHGFTSPQIAQLLGSGALVGHIGAPRDIPALVSGLSRRPTSRQHDWAVAQLPNPTGQPERVVSYGGSSWAVFKDCPSVTDALAFAATCSRNADLLVPRGLMPAANVDKLVTPQAWQSIGSDVVAQLSDLGARITRDSARSPAWQATCEAFAPITRAWTGSAPVSTMLPAVADAAARQTERYGLRVR